MLKPLSDINISAVESQAELPHKGGWATSDQAGHRRAIKTRVKGHEIKVKWGHQGNGQRMLLEIKLWEEFSKRGARKRTWGSGAPGKVNEGVHLEGANHAADGATTTTHREEPVGEVHTAQP